MSIIEKILLISVCLAPVVALLFILPKKKKKPEQPKQTASYVTLEQEKAIKQEQTGAVAETKQEELPKNNNLDDLENYRDFLNKRHDLSSRPQKRELPKDFLSRTTAYDPSLYGRNRKNTTSNVDINNLSPEIKAMLIAGILDRKF